MSLLLVVPDRSGGSPSGGDRYDAAVAAAWRRAGREVEVVAVPGGWPWPSRDDRRRLGEVLHGSAAPVLVDGLVACAAPAEVEACARRRPTVVLVHSVLSEGAGVTGDAAAELDAREARALAAAHEVVATSRFAAADLRRRYALGEVAVAVPGVDPAPVAAGSGAPAPQLLALGAVTPLKNHALLLDALEQVADLPWDAVVAGQAADVQHLEALQARAGAAGLQGRVRWAGPLTGPALEEVWAATDLLVHPSRSETYGMAVAEAHAHGVPTVVGAGTGAVEALRGRGDGGSPGGRVSRQGGGPTPVDLPGAAVSTDDPAELAQALRTWLTDPALRGRWRSAALARRERQPSWDDTARQLDTALTRAQERSAEQG